MANSKPLVSIVVTNYNYAKFIREAIESALAQTYQNIELVIIDDGSTDNSMKVIKHYENTQHVRIISRENKGVIHTRNEGLAKSRGVFICFLDADDILPADYITNMVDTATATNADVVYGDMIIVDVNGNENGEKYVFPDFSVEELKKHNYINMTSLIKSSAIAKQKFDSKLDDLGYTHEDWDFFLGLALKGKKIVKANDAALRYRVHENSRNGGLSEINQHAKHIKSAIFIYNKYKKLYPDEFQSSEVDPIKYWLEGIINDREGLKRTIEFRDVELQKKRVVISKNEMEIARLSKEVSEILHSKSYRVGNVVASPYRLLKRRKHVK